MFLSKHWERSNFKHILIIFVTWKVGLLLALLVAVNFVPLAGKNFYGGGLDNYQKNPYFYAWANFDGEHYLSIAQIGYKGLEHAFFPVYPALIHFFSANWSNDPFPATLAGLFISGVCFFLAILFLFKLLRLDYTEKISYLTIFVLILFPTAFYFASLYNESLFLLLAVLTFYCARKKKWFLAGILGMIASATRVFGFLLFLSLLIEVWQSHERSKRSLWILLIPCGLIFYMFYLWYTTGDPIAFYHLQKSVGPQHQEGITLLPQVYYRYLKILVTADITNPIYPTMILEAVSGVLFFLLPIYGYVKRIRLSYLFYSLFGFMIPAIQGSFSSSPRYVLILFPSFLILAVIVNRLPKLLKVSYFILSVAGLGYYTIMFLRGYWVA